MADRIQFRGDTTANWKSVNPVLLKNEIGFITDSVNQFKIGDGVRTFNQLPLYGFDGIQLSLANLSNDILEYIQTAAGTVGSITNYPDGEDLTSYEDPETHVKYLKLKDKPYQPNLFSGKGYKILRKNISNSKNLLVQSVINDTNTIYEVRYDFDLNGQQRTFPVGCTVFFNGGSFKHGTIIGNNTRVIAFNSNIKGENLTVSGTWDMNTTPEWN